MSVPESERGEGGAPMPLRQNVNGASFAVDVSENWQSEFLAVGSMAVPAIFLRQRGSPESEPVGTSPRDTGIEGRAEEKAA